MTKEELIKYVQFLYDNELCEEHKEQDQEQCYENDWRLQIINNFDSFYEDDGEYRIYSGINVYYIYENKYQDWKQYIRLKKLERIIK